jgi:hypothetical protein
MFITLIVFRNLCLCLSLLLEYRKLHRVIACFDSRATWTPRWNSRDHIWMYLELSSTKNVLRENNFVSFFINFLCYIFQPFFVIQSSLLMCLSPQLLSVWSSLCCVSSLPSSPFVSFSQPCRLLAHPYHAHPFPITFEPAISSYNNFTCSLAPSVTVSSFFIRFVVLISVDTFWWKLII